jgi:hypothetical protein
MLQKIESKDRSTYSFCPDNSIEDEIDQKIYLLLATSPEPLGSVEIAMLVETGVVDAKHRLNRLSEQIEYDSYHETYQIKQHDHRPNPSNENHSRLLLPNGSPTQPPQSQERRENSPTHPHSRSDVGSSPQMAGQSPPPKRSSDTPRRQPQKQCSEQPESIPQEPSQQSSSQNLSTEETRPEIEKLESTIANGLKAFYEVGMALLEIRDRKLYKQHGYTQFEAYCQERWGMKRAHAYRLIGSAIVVQNVSQWETKLESEKMSPIGRQNEELKMSPIGRQNEELKMSPIGRQNEEHKTFTNGTQILPTNERQVRPLTKLPPEQQIIAWKRAVETAPHGRITALHIKKTINKMHARQREEKTIPPTYVPGDLVISNKNEVFIIVEDRPSTVIAQSWKDTPHQELFKYNIEPIIKNKQIMLMTNLPIEQIAALQERYSSLKNAIEELLNGRNQ